MYLQTLCSSIYNRDAKLGFLRMLGLQVLTKETKINFLKTVGQQVQSCSAACLLCMLDTTDFDILILDYDWLQVQRKKKLAVSTTCNISLEYFPVFIQEYFG